MLRVAGYCRVSTKDQVDGISLDHQAEKNMRWSDFMEYNFIGNYIEKGVSGAKESRAELDKLLADAKEGKFDIVVIYKADRFSRDLRIAVETYHELNKCGVSLYIIDGSIDTATPMGKMLFYLLSMFAEMDRDNIKNRLDMGKMAKLKSGAWIGKKPYGYKVKNGQLEMIPEEAEVINNIFVWKAYKDKSLREIAEILNNKKIPSPSGKKWKFPTVNAIIMNKLYYGVYEYNGMEIPLEYEPIVTKQVWTRANNKKAGVA